MCEEGDPCLYLNTKNCCNFCLSSSSDFFANLWWSSGNGTWLWWSKIFGMCYNVFLLFSLFFHGVWMFLKIWMELYVGSWRDRRNNLWQDKDLSLWVFSLVLLFGRGKCCINGKNAHGVKFLGSLTMDLQKCPLHRRFCS
jgi:hypothetical protein